MTIGTVPVSWQYVWTNPQKLRQKYMKKGMHSQLSQWCETLEDVIRQRWKHVLGDWQISKWRQILEDLSWQWSNLIVVKTKFAKRGQIPECFCCYSGDVLSPHIKRCVARSWIARTVISYENSIIVVENAISTHEAFGERHIQGNLLWRKRGPAAQFCISSQEYGSKWRETMEQGLSQLQKVIVLDIQSLEGSKWCE